MRLATKNSIVIESASRFRECRNICEYSSFVGNVYFRNIFVSGVIAKQKFLPILFRTHDTVCCILLLCFQTSVGKIRDLDKMSHQDAIYIGMWE